jgi:hypothetical protein
MPQEQVGLRAGSVRSLQQQPFQVATACATATHASLEKAAQTGRGRRVNGTDWKLIACCVDAVPARIGIDQAPHSTTVKQPLEGQLSHALTGAAMAVCMPHPLGCVV